MRAHRSFTIWLLAFGFLAVHCKPQAEVEPSNLNNEADSVKQDSETKESISEKVDLASLDEELYSGQYDTEAVRIKRLETDRRRPMGPPPNIPSRTVIAARRVERGRTRHVTEEDRIEVQRVLNAMNNDRRMGPTGGQGPFYGQGPSRAQGPSYSQGPSRVQGPSYGQRPSRAQGPSYGPGPSRAQGPSYGQGPSRAGPSRY